ncbi:hypothetical protein TGS27_1020 [Geobacillus stearothermophilus]|nr:hypothetical protein TGS27_1020 [Geobacillus stearothermophilus]
MLPFRKRFQILVHVSCFIHMHIISPSFAKFLSRTANHFIRRGKRPPPSTLEKERPFGKGGSLKQRMRLGDGH